MVYAISSLYYAIDCKFTRNLLFPTFSFERKFFVYLSSSRISHSTSQKEETVADT